MTTITVKIANCKEDGGFISSINGWLFGSDCMEKPNGKTWSEWERRPMTADEAKAEELAFAAFRANGCKPGNYTVEI